METNGKILEKNETLRSVHSKLEAKRDELMDRINAVISSNHPDRVSIIYKAELKLVSIEKALDLNRFFMIQNQEEVMKNLIANDMTSGLMDSLDNKSDENLTTKTNE